MNARLAEVSSALVVAQQTAQAAQALHAGTIRQQLTDGEDRSKSTGADGGRRKKAGFQKFWWQIGNKSIVFFVSTSKKAV